MELAPQNDIVSNQLSQSVLSKKEIIETSNINKNEKKNDEHNTMSLISTSNDKKKDAEPHKMMMTSISNNEKKDKKKDAEHDKMMMTSTSNDKQKDEHDKIIMTSISNNKKKDKKKDDEHYKMMMTSISNDEKKDKKKDEHDKMMMTSISNEMNMKNMITDNKMTEREHEKITGEHQKMEGEHLKMKKENQVLHKEHADISKRIDEHEKRMNTFEESILDWENEVEDILKINTHTDEFNYDSPRIKTLKQSMIQLDSEADVGIEKHDMQQNFGEGDDSDLLRVNHFSKNHHVDQMNLAPTLKEMQLPTYDSRFEDASMGGIVVEENEHPDMIRAIQKEIVNKDDTAPMIEMVPGNKSTDTKKSLDAIQKEIVNKDDTAPMIEMVPGNKSTDTKKSLDAMPIKNEKTTDFVTEKSNGTKPIKNEKTPDFVTEKSNGTKPIKKEKTIDDNLVTTLVTEENSMMHNIQQKENMKDDVSSMVMNMLNEHQKMKTEHLQMHKEHLTMEKDNVIFQQNSQSLEKDNDSMRERVEQQETRIKKIAKYIDDWEKKIEHFLKMDTDDNDSHNIDTLENTTTQDEYKTSRQKDKKENNDDKQEKKAHKLSATDRKLMDTLYFKQQNVKKEDNVILHLEQNDANHPNGQKVMMEHEKALNGEATREQDRLTKIGTEHADIEQQHVHIHEEHQQLTHDFDMIEKEQKLVHEGHDELNERLSKQEKTMIDLHKKMRAWQNKIKEKIEDDGFVALGDNDEEIKKNLMDAVKELQNETDKDDDKYSEMEEKIDHLDKKFDDLLKGQKILLKDLIEGWKERHPDEVLSDTDNKDTISLKNDQGVIDNDNEDTISLKNDQGVIDNDNKDTISLKNGKRESPEMEITEKKSHDDEQVLLMGMQEKEDLNTHEMEDLAQQMEDLKEYMDDYTTQTDDDVQDLEDQLELKDHTVQELEDPIVQDPELEDTVEETVEDTEDEIVHLLEKQEKSDSLVQETCPDVVQCAPGFTCFQGACQNEAICPFTNHSLYFCDDLSFHEDHKECDKIIMCSKTNSVMCADGTCVSSLGLCTTDVMQECPYFRQELYTVNCNRSPDFESLKCGEGLQKGDGKKQFSPLITKSISEQCCTEALGQTDSKVTDKSHEVHGTLQWIVEKLNIFDHENRFLSWREAIKNWGWISTFLVGLILSIILITLLGIFTRWVSSKLIPTTKHNEEKIQEESFMWHLMMIVVHIFCCRTQQRKGNTPSQRNNATPENRKKEYDAFKKSLKDEATELLNNENNNKPPVKANSPSPKKKRGPPYANNTSKDNLPTISQLIQTPQKRGRSPTRS